MLLHYEIHGPDVSSAPSVLMSSGLGGSANYWKPQLQALLNAGKRVIIYDQLGTGRSPAQLPFDYAISDMARDVCSILEASRTDTCHFVGHALGGLVGLQIALDSPKRIASLTLVNSWAAPNPHSARCFSARLSLLDAGGPEAYVAAQPIFLYPAAWAVENAELIDAEVAHAIEVFPGERNMRTRIGALCAFDVQDRLANVICPVFVCAAMDDVLVPWTQSRHLVQHMPNASFEYTPHGGHAHNITSPEAFNRTLLEFLARLPN